MKIHACWGVFFLCLGGLPGCSSDGGSTASVSDPSPLRSPAPAKPDPAPAPVPDPTSDPVVEPKVEERFHRIRVIYTSTSDWSWLKPVDVAAVQAVRVYEVSDHVGTRHAFDQYLSIFPVDFNDPATKPTDAKPLKMVVDYAIDPARVAAGGFQFRIGKGSVGTAKAQVLGYANGAYSAIEEFVNTGAVQADPIANARTFTLAAAKLSQYAPLQTVSYEPIPKKAMAFYYPWFVMADWTTNKEFSDTPLVPYATDDVENVKGVVDNAIKAGLTGFISSWWGIGNRSDVRVPTLIRAIEGRPFEFSIYYETIRGGAPLPDQEIVKELVHILKNYGGHPQYVRVDGRPAVFLYRTEDLPAERWKAILAQVRQQAGAAFFIATRCDADLSVFDGAHEYAHINIQDLAQHDLSCSKGVRNHYMLSDDHVRKLWTGTAMPGYDDTLATNRTQHFVIDRENGDYYRRSLEAALDSRPDWMAITSWNEWGENSHIEPSVKYGTFYRDLTRAYFDPWLGR